MSLEHCTPSVSFAAQALREGFRADGRAPFDRRALSLRPLPGGGGGGRVAGLYGCGGGGGGAAEAEAAEGSHVLAAVALTLCDVSRELRGKEGRVGISLEYAPSAAPQHAGGGQAATDGALEASRLLERAFVGTRAVDAESLCEAPGYAAWRVDVKCVVLRDCGAALDVAAAAAAAALLCTRVPQVTVDDESKAVTVHSPEEREPRALTLHHLPVCLTFAAMGGDDEVVCADPSLEEEAAAAADGATLSVLITKHKELCGMRKGGRAGVRPELIARCVRVATSRAGDIADAVRAAAEEHAKAEVKRRVRRAEGTAPKTFVVGYACAPARAAALTSRGLLAEGVTAGSGGRALRFVALTDALAAGTAVDLVLYKPSDFLVGPAAAAEANVEAVAPGAGGGVYTVDTALGEALVKAGAPQADDMSRVGVLLDRAATLRALGGASVALPRGVRLPRWAAVEEGACAVAAACEVGVRGAVMLKPRVAAGAPGAHAMALAREASQLAAGAAALGVPEPSVVQEFVFHSGVLHKVYVIGAATLTVAKPSLRNALVRGLRVPERFDALQDFKALAACGGDEAAEGEAAAARPADEATLIAAAEALRAALRLRLFGFDVVVDDATGEHVIVDVNYWPSFSGAGVGDAEVARLLRQALLQQC